MTQLVQLRQALPALQEAGFEVFAISNDTVERLAHFSQEHDIPFDLLSDEDSAVIRAFGIMNMLIRPDEGKHMRWYGIPYPGTYITDGDGVVVDKDFHQHHARRLSGPALVHRVLGTAPLEHADAPMATGDGDDLSLSAAMVDPTLRLEVLSLLVCRLRVADGRHVYAAGAPEAFTPITLEFRGDGVRFGEPAWPKADELEMTELNLRVPVYTGEVEVTIPITATSSLIRLGHGLEAGKTTATIAITCTYQSCDESSCGLPTAIESNLVVPLETLVEPPGVKSYVERVSDGSSADAPSAHSD